MFPAASCTATVNHMLLFSSTVFVPSSFVVSTPVNVQFVVASTFVKAAETFVQPSGTVHVESSAAAERSVCFSGFVAEAAYYVPCGFP